MHYKYMDCKQEIRRTGQMKGRRSIKGGGLCIPRLRSNRASPGSLLERLREIVFRLIMLSAITKTQHSGSASAGSSGSRAYPPDSYYSEAVADCIEFIKKSASEQDGRGSSASSSTAPEVALPTVLSVM